MRKLYNIEHFKNLATEKDGKCISVEYKTLNSKLKWECSNGHIWETIPASILKGTWCKICSTLGRRFGTR